MKTKQIQEIMEYLFDIKNTFMNSLLIVWVIGCSTSLKIGFIVLEKIIMNSPFQVWVFLATVLLLSFTLVCSFILLEGFFSALGVIYILSLFFSSNHISFFFFSGFLILFVFGCVFYHLKLNRKNIK